MFHDVRINECAMNFVIYSFLSSNKIFETDGIETLSTNFREFLLVYRTWNKSNDVPQLLFLPVTFILEEE